MSATSFLVNLLTEDNSPHYTSRLQSITHSSGALSAFTNKWTEADAHGVIMRDYALLSRLIGEGHSAVITNADYHASRVSQLSSGTGINPSSLQSGFAYLALQELLTKEAHRKTTWLLPTSGRTAVNPIISDQQNYY